MATLRQKVPSTAQVVEFLRKRGCTAENLSGGLERWAGQGLPIECP